MSQATLPLRTPTPETAARRLLACIPGWSPARGRPRVVEVMGRRFRVSRLAVQGRRCALLYDPLSHPALPGYRLRRAAHGPRAGRVVVFSDPAGCVQVWSWTERLAGGVLAYRESWCGPEPPGARLLFALAAAPERSRPARAERADEPLRRALAEALLPRPARRPGPGGHVGQRLQDHVEGLDDPAELRAFWGRLTEIRVLDPRCGAGGWLLSAMELLEPVYLACLERMQGWVEEERRVGPRGHPERLRAFRELLARADDQGCHPTRLEYVRERLLLCTVHGVDGDPAAVDACRARLRMRLHAAGGPDGEAPPEEFCALCVGILAPGGGERGGEETGAQAELLGRAERLLHRLRLERGVGARETAAALAELRARARALVPEAEALPRWAAFPAASLSGGFTRVRADVRG